MIKPSTASPASQVAPRRAASTEPESRTVGREGENGAFAEAMEAQGPRDDGGSCQERTSTVKEAGEPDESNGATAGSAAPGSPTAAPLEAPTGPGADPMLGLCAAQAADPSSGCTGDPVMSGDGPAGCGAPQPALAVTEPGVAFDARELQEGERQARLALDAAARMAAPGAQAEGAAGASAPGSLENAAGAPGAVNPAGLAVEVRGTDRTSATQMAQAPGRPPDMRAPLGSTAWADELGARVTWMVDRGEQVASLRLSPENLGPVEVRIAVREGETSVWFGATHAETRAALEQSLPRLREMLGASGLSLADAGVFSHTPRDPQRGFTSAALARAAQESGADPAGGIVMQVSRRGLVDLYA
jgi:flagellar hook-length control protein FliK